MDKRKELADSFQTTSWLIGKFAEGMSHEDSVAQPPFRANTFNWVLGHLVVARDRVLLLLGQERVLNKRETEIYDTGSAPATAETALRLEHLLQALGASQASLAAGFELITLDVLAATYDEEKGQTIADRISGLHWHETYHVGQLEILRQVSGEKEPFP